MEDIFQDISKYYAANIVENVLTIGKIVYLDGVYSFIRDDVKGPFNLVDPDADVTRFTGAHIHLVAILVVDNGVNTGHARPGTAGLHAV